jgi:uncharacterized protein YxeA
MKKIIRILILLLVLSSVAGITTSCAVFNESHTSKHAPFKHKQPLPKKYILSNGYKPIVK